MSDPNPFTDVALADDNLSTPVDTNEGNPGFDAAMQEQSGQYEDSKRDNEGLEPLEVELPSSGNASWPEAACHTVTAVVGAGVLGLPFAFSRLGWTAGVLFLVASCATSLYTSWQLATLHERDGVRINRYRDLGRAVLGETWGWLAIVPFQFSVMIGLAITYTVTGAESMRIIEELAGDEGVCLTKYVFIFGVFQLVLSQIPDFRHLWWVSIVGAAMSVGYSLLSGILSIAASDNLPAPVSYTNPETGWAWWRSVFNALGSVTFAYGGHSVLLEIQATLRSPPPARENMMKGVYLAYVVSGVAYFFVSFAGYASYGVSVAENVLLSEPRHAIGWIGIANTMVLLHVLASYQVFAQPVFEALESYVIGRSDKMERNSKWLRLGWRSAFVLMTTLIAATLPFFTDLMGLIGAIGFTPMTFVMPSVLWMIANRGNLPHWDVVLNCAIVVFFSVVGLLAFVASAANIAHKASEYGSWCS